MAKNVITYDGNEKETYTLFLDEKEVADLIVGEDGAIEIVDIIKDFLNEKVSDTDIVDIKNDKDELGVIVDIFVKDDEIKDSLTIWFDNINNDRFCVKCGKTSGLIENEDMCYTCAEKRGRV